MAPLSAVLVLWDAWVHVCTLNGCNILPNVEASVDEHFGIAATLSVPYIYPNNGYVRFRGYLDYPWP